MLSVGDENACKYCSMYKFNILTLDMLVVV